MEEYSGFYAVPKDTCSQHGIPIKISNLDKDTLLEDINDTELKEQFNSCKHFLVDSEIGKGTHSLFNFAMSASNNSFLKEKKDHVYSQLKSAAKVNLAFGFVLKNNEGTCRYFYAHENNTVMERS